MYLVGDVNFGERFEGIKEAFVKHFNDKHQDIMRNRTRSSNKRTFKKIKSLDGIILSAYLNL